MPYTVRRMEARPKIALARLALGAFTVCIAACTPSPNIEERTLYVYAPRSCPVSQSEAYSVIYGNGDFDDSESTVASLYLRDVGREMTELPSATRSVIVDVSHPAQSIDWRGTAEVPKSGAVNVLVWPGSETCRLSRNVEPRTEVTLGVFGRHLMVAGGRLEGQVPHTFVGDLSTGVVDKLEFGLGTRRSRATVTAFRDHAGQDPAPALVAGGEDPDSQAPLGTAEIYLPMPGAPGDLGDFDRVRIDLAEVRTKHGAVVLATGETLLVGGTGQGGGPLRTMEIIDPKTRRNRTSGVALLAVPRTNPSVLRLASGEILVAGGVNDRGQSVPTLEWFSADASRTTKRPVELVTGRERAFVPLEAGGALAVIAPSSGGSDFKTVWVISADGTVDAAVPIDPSVLDVVRLFPGTDGAPVLWTGQRWLRWQPWFGAFQPIPDAPLRGPRTSAVAAGDSGLALWLDDRADDDDRVLLDGQLYVRGYRFATRSRFGTVRNPLLVDGPSGLAPDRVTGTPGSSINFVEGRGLELGPGASAFVTDVTYADVTIELDGAASPSVVLRQEDGRELEVGGATCAFAQTATRSLKVTRHGKRVDVSVDDGEPRVCPTELDVDARVSVGVRGAGGTATSLARNLRITRR
jgi:hypothetical protein